jgi:hypothetical protein
MYDYLYVKSQESEDLKEALGISEERCKELCGLIYKIHSANRDASIADLLSESSKHCQNANELAFVSFIVGTHATPVKVSVHEIRSEGVPDEILGMFHRMMRQRSRGMESFSHN